MFWPDRFETQRVCSTCGQPTSKHQKTNRMLAGCTRCGPACGCLSPWCLILMLSPGRILQSSLYHRPSTSTWLTSQRKFTVWRSLVSTSSSSFTMQMCRAGRYSNLYRGLVFSTRTYFHGISKMDRMSQSQGHQWMYQTPSYL